jgi:hypothetical protein
MSQLVYLDIPAASLRADTLVAAVAGGHPDVPPSAALSLLAEIDLPGADRQQLLRDVVRNADLDPQVRAGAVRIYTRAAGAAAVPTLLRVLEEGTERVAAAVAPALGRVGTPDELDALRRLRTGASGGLLRRRATFAEALVVHRFGLTDRETALPPVETLPAPSSTGALAFSGVRPGLTRRDRVLKAVQRELPAFDVGKQDVYEVQCGPRLLEIAVDQDFVGPEGAARLRSRPAAPAVVAVRSPEHDDFYLALIALSSPDGKDGVTVRLCRPSGDAVYLVDGSLRGDELALELRTVQAPGATPVAGQVRLTTGGIEISGVSGSVSTPAQTPQAT